MSASELTHRYRRYLARFGSRDSDIWVATYSKSGTTWVQMILYQLTTAGDMSFNHLFDISPWVYYAALRQVEPAATPDPRILKTHDDYAFIASATRGRYIYVLRDGKDVVVSWYHHRRNFRGFEGSFDSHFDEFLHGCAYNWFQHVKDWLENPRQLPLLYVKYEELQRDFDATLERVADFLDLTPEMHVLERVRARCRFDFMQAHDNQLGPRVSHFPAGADVPYKIKAAPFLRKGTVGEWVSVLTDKQLLAYRRKFDEVLGSIDAVADYR